MVRPEQTSLIARKLADIPITAAVHRGYLARAGAPRSPSEPLQHKLIGDDRDDTIIRGLAAMGLVIPSRQFSVRTDEQVAYGRLVAAGAGSASSRSTTSRTGPAWSRFCRH